MADHRQGRHHPRLLRLQRVLRRPGRGRALQGRARGLHRPHPAPRNTTAAPPPAWCWSRRSPFENLSAKRDLPDGTKENANLALYAKAMAEVAAARQVEFVDLFDSTAKLYAGTMDQPFTRNGFLPSDEGYKKLGPVHRQSRSSARPRARPPASPPPSSRPIRDKDWFWFNDYKHAERRPRRRPPLQPLRPRRTTRPRPPRCAP
jgi:hypothetical protein